MRKKALIIEDDEHFVECISPHIELLGFDMEWAADGEKGLELALAHDYSFVLLDNVLPKLEGIEVCRGIREAKPQLPLIVISTDAGEVSKVLLLELGADEYIVKPFSAPELKARIRAVLRRSERLSDEERSVLEFADLRIDLSSRTATLAGSRLELTGYEFSILALLASVPGKVFSRQEIVESVYGDEVVGYERSVNTHISNLRNKIETDSNTPKYLVTVRGFGYRLGDQE